MQYILLVSNSLKRIIYSPYTHLKMGNSEIMARISSLILILLAIICIRPSPAYAEDVNFSIHLGSFKDIKNAIVAVSKLKNNGYDAFYRYESVEDNGKWYRVYAGKYASKYEAEREADTLRRLDLISYYTIKIINNTPGSEAEAAGRYYLHVSSFSNEFNAGKEIKRLEKHGYKCFSLEESVSGRSWFRVYIGSFSDEENARKAGTELKGKEIISFFNPKRISRELPAGAIRPAIDLEEREPVRKEYVIDRKKIREPAISDDLEHADKTRLPVKETAFAGFSGEEGKTESRDKKKSLFQYDFRGQLSGWSIQTRDRGSWWNKSGLRYIPQFSVKKPLASDSFVDLEVSANGFAAYESNDQDRDPEVELYRFKLRYATPQMETRIGLQKLNFGPAFLLRSLKWFDQLDPRDPLQLTEGVYGLRFRYDAINNANIWFWALYGNEDLKGYESFPTSPDTLEIGGRLQVPVPRGEVALTYHTRQVDAAFINAKKFREYRMALDGRWDVGIGLWFESALQHQDEPNLPYEWQKMITLGADYTFGIGSGLHFLAEHMATAVSEEAFRWDEGFQVSAFSLSYSLDFFDSLSAIGYYSWDFSAYGQYLAWQRTYDDLIFQLSGFHYPQSSGGALGGNQTALGAGYGGQLMVIYNH